ncbi:MAG: hypothetical protein A2289_14675 [Deltaproteobacteria bacterium RIFOXYA12_FULL_58_15]|nr:MAG: hypothetical protein A2289_14675 [Deltaproteobacteria bacterium RIFOXYA12_FULL_58_15]
MPVAVSPMSLRSVFVTGSSKWMVNVVAAADTARLPLGQKRSVLGRSRPTTALPCIQNASSCLYGPIGRFEKPNSTARFGDTQPAPPSAPSARFLPAAQERPARPAETGVGMEEHKVPLHSFAVDRE